MVSVHRPTFPDIDRNLLLLDLVDCLWIIQWIMRIQLMNNKIHQYQQNFLPAKIRPKERSRSQTTPTNTDINDPENLDYEDIDDNHPVKKIPDRRQILHGYSL